MPQHKGGKKNRKIGRNKVKCERYRLARSVRNKIEKLMRHLTTHVDDVTAKAALARVK